MISIAICDDEKYYLNKIDVSIRKIFLNKGISAYEIDKYLSGEELCNQNSKLHEYDVVFLDINMPEKSGLEIAKAIKEQRPDILLVFITAYIDYAVEGYKMEAIRFLIKDMLEEMLPECLGTVIHKLNLQARRIEYAFLEGKKEIFVDKVSFIESQKHKLIFHVIESGLKQYSIYGKLDQIEKDFLTYGFLRIHKSYLVNAAYIKNVTNYKVKLNPDIELPVPREKYQKVKELYYEMKG